MTTEKQMTKYERNFKYNVHYAEVGQSMKDAMFVKSFTNANFAEAAIREIFINNPELIGKGQYFVSFESFPLFSVEFQIDNGNYIMVERSYYGSTTETTPTDTDTREDDKAEEVKDEPEMEVHSYPKKQVAFTQLWKAWSFLYASDYTISKAAAQRWLKAQPVIFCSPECAADTLRDYVVELNEKKDAE